MLQESITPRYPPIEKMILTGMTQSLEMALGIPKEKILFVASTDRLKLAAKLVEMQKGPGAKIEWPIMFVHLQQVTSGIEGQKHGYNAKSLARHGIFTKIDQNQLRVRKINLIPTVFDFEAIYMVDDFNSAFGFANNWIAQAVHNRANFTIDYGGVGIDIKVEMSQSMQTPDAEASVEQPNVFEYTSTLSVVGFVNDPHPDGESEIQILRKPVVNVSIDGLPKADPQLWSGRHVMPILKDKK